MEKETIYGQVIGKSNNYMIGNSGESRHIIKNPQIREYESIFARQCKLYRDKRISGRFTLFVAVYQSSIRYDLDNSLKTVLDCLQMVNAIINDSQCFKIVAEKRLDKVNPRVVFSIEETEPRQTELFR